MASKQMLKLLLPSARKHHLARTHLFVTPNATKRRNKLWASSMEADVLVYDFQDGCPPKDYPHVMDGLGKAHGIYPNKALTVRVTELESDDGSKIYNELKAGILQRQVHWFMLPMCDTVQDVEEYINIINDIDPNWLVHHGALQIVCETPKGLHNLHDMLDSIPQIAGVIAGGADYFRFAQGTYKSLLQQLRWDVLNACLCHGRFPIDAPPLSLSSDENDDDFGWQLQSAVDSGFRSGVILYPEQAEVANSKFSPLEKDIASAKVHVPHWLETRETGYKRGSGNDFIGPPHMKQKTWILHYEAEIKAKKIAHTQKVDREQIKGLLALLKPLAKQEPDVWLEKGINTSLLGFLALASSCHPRHQDLLANLGSSNVNTDYTYSLEDAAYVTQQIVSRKSTSDRSAVIVTYRVEILEKDFKPICTMTKRLMEKPIEFDIHVDEDAASHILSLPKPRKDKAEIESSIKENGIMVEQERFISPDVDTHFNFCKLLSLDAPLHHTVDEPTVPSTLHLACHQIDANYSKHDGWSCQYSDITYHSQMKPSKAYTRSLYKLNQNDKEEVQSYLSVIENDNENFLSTVFYERKVENSR